MSSLFVGSLGTIGIISNISILAEVLPYKFIKEEEALINLDSE